MKKMILLAALLLWLLSAPALAQRYRGYQIQFQDAEDNPYNMGTSVSLYIYAVGTTTELTVYKDMGGGSTCTQPITDNSTNTPLNYVNGMLEFWTTARSYKITVTDGTYTTSFDPLNEGDHVIRWPPSGVAGAGNSLGQNDDLDFSYAGFIFDGDTAGRVDLIPDADGGIFGIGNGTYQTDFYWYAGATDWVFGDEGNARMTFVDVDAVFDDDAHIYIGTDLDVDIKYDNSGADLDILADDKEIAIGADGAGADIYWHTETASANVLFGEDELEVLLTNVDLRIDDDGIAYFGTDKDFSIKSASTTVLSILPLTTDETSTINFGADTAGVKVKIFGATTGEYIEYAAATDTLTANTGNVLFTGTDAEANQFKVDATGTVAGYAIVLETTDGGVQVNADGAANGDISVDAADDMSIVAGNDWTATASGAVALFSNAVAQTVTLGNETGASSLAFKAGTGNITMDGVAATTITIGDAAQTAAITIGASTATMTDLSLGTGVGAHTIHIGDGGTAAQVVTIGSTSGASAVTVQSGTGDISITSQDDIGVGTNAVPRTSVSATRPGPRR